MWEESCRNLSLLPAQLDINVVGEGGTTSAPLGQNWVKGQAHHRKGQEAKWNRNFQVRGWGGDLPVDSTHSDRSRVGDRHERKPMEKPRRRDTCLRNVPGQQFSRGEAEPAWADSKPGEEGQRCKETERK